MKTSGIQIKTLRIVFAILVILALFAWLVVMPTNLVQNAISSAKIDSWLNRAKDAGNPQQVAEFLQEYKDALYQANRVEGRYYSVFKFPGTFMPTYIRAVDGLIQRATDLAKQNPTDTSYQMGLVNLEKDLGDIEAVAYGVWWANGGCWLILGLVFGGLIGTIVFGILYFDTN